MCGRWPVCVLRGRNLSVSEGYTYIEKPMQHIPITVGHELGVVFPYSFVMHQTPVIMLTPTFSPLRGCAFVLVFICAAISSQCQTTLEEYNYISKGIKATVEFGLDIKTGYELGEVRQWSTPVSGTADGVRHTAVFVLYRKATMEPAGVFMMLKRTDTDFLKTVCIPLPSSSKEVMTAATKDFALATSEWSEQARTYCWHLALVFAQEIEAKTSAVETSVAESHFLHPIDRQLQACLTNVDYDRDGSDFVAPDYGCLWTALEAWQNELKSKQQKLLSLLTGENRATMASHLKAWDGAYETIQAEMGIETFGGSMYDGPKLRAELDLVQARVSMIETYIGIAEEVRH